MKKKPQYEKIADQICREISNGDFQTGDRLYSRNEIVIRFNVSPMTAVRVQNTLAERGVVRKVRGGGIFLLPDKPFSFSEKLALGKQSALRKIVYLNVLYSYRNHYQNRYVECLKKAVAEAGIPYEEKRIKASDVAGNLMQYFEIEFDAGYVVINTGSIPIFFGAAVLLDSSVKSVLIDGIMVGTDSIIVDSLDGMRKLVEEHLKRGCVRFLYAENFAKYFSGLNAAERLQAAKYVLEMKNIPLEIISSGNYEDLLREVRQDPRMTAVIFPQDTPACTFQKMLNRNKIRNVSVSGFDHFSELRNPLPILTVDTDFGSWASETIRLLRDNHSEGSVILKMPGKLIVP